MIETTEPSQATKLETQSTRQSSEFPDLSRCVLSAAGIVGSCILVVALSTRSPTGCDRLPHVIGFAGTTDRFESGLDRFGCDSVGIGIGDSRWHLALAVLAVALIGSFVAWLLSVWWPAGWRSAPFKNWRSIPYLAATGTGLLVVGGIIGLLALGVSDGRVTLRSWGAWLIPALAWPGAGLVLACLVLVGFAVLGAIGSMHTPHPKTLPDEPAVDYLEATVNGLGICVSGGGIRAGGVALGALWKLEQTAASDLTPLNDKIEEFVKESKRKARLEGGTDDEIDDAAASALRYKLENELSVLDSARYLASVSGGGYVAGAYRIARGTDSDRPRPDPEIWEQGIFGADGEVFAGTTIATFDDPGSMTLPYNLRRHVMTRRRFLLTGRGGLVGSLGLAMCALVFQAILIVLVAFLVAWPLGRLATSWAVIDSGDLTDFSFSWRIAVPSIVLLAVALLLTLATIDSWNTSRRRRTHNVIAALIGGAAALAVLLIVVPYTVPSFVGDNLAPTFAAAGAALAGTVATLATRVLTAHLAPKLARLGGVLLAITFALLVLIIAGEAAAPGGTFNGDGWRLGYFTALLAFVGCWSFLDPRWWSLHVLYRHRLRGAFAVTSEPKHGQPGHPGASVSGTVPVGKRVYPVASSTEPELADYAAAPGPETLICASAARRSRQSTGVTALSFVMSPHMISLYDVRRDSETTNTYEYSRPTDEYLDFIGPRPSRRRQALGTITAAMALSGAAVSSSMGRASLGSTNALLAALNVRLGTWMPNPRYLECSDPVGDERPSPAEDNRTQRAKRTRMNYLLKEILGGYDTDEPYLYITDGGHRENLGLVELLRRRCRTIICIDASGDTPGSFSTLMQAARLARTECLADLQFGKQLDGLRAAGPFERPTKCVAAIPIRYGYRDKDTQEVKYDDGAQYGGTLLYAKAIVDQSDEELRSFSEEDSDFPNYSTGNQFLSEDQARMLIRLGGHMARSAIDEGRSAVREALQDPPAARPRTRTTSTSDA